MFQVTTIAANHQNPLCNEPYRSIKFKCTNIDSLIVRYKVVQKYILLSQLDFFFRSRKTLQIEIRNDGVAFFRKHTFPSDIQDSLVVHAIHDASTQASLVPGAYKFNVRFVCGSRSRNILIFLPKSLLMFSVRSVPSAQWGEHCCAMFALLFFARLTLNR